MEAKLGVLVHRGCLKTNTVKQCDVLASTIGHIQSYQWVKRARKTAWASSTVAGPTNDSVKCKHVIRLSFLWRFEELFIHTLVFGDSDFLSDIIVLCKIHDSLKIFVSESPLTPTPESPNSPSGSKNKLIAPAT